MEHISFRLLSTERGGGIGVKYLNVDLSASPSKKKREKNTGSVAYEPTSDPNKKNA